MTKGDPAGVGRLFDSKKLIAVYSDENLNEIKKSKGYEENFLSLLKSIAARYLKPNMQEYRYTGSAQVFEGDPKEIFHSYVENTEEMPKYGYGISGMAQKMWGGLQNASFAEILEGGADELKQLLDIDPKDIDELPIDEEKKSQIKSMLEILPTLVDEANSEFANISNYNLPENAVKTFEEASGLGPKVLKNIKGPDVVGQIWKMIRESIPHEITTLEQFFGLDLSAWGNIQNLSTVEKVNAIYHQLNFVGYYRDSGMKKEKRFNASFSDMTHAGMASFCRLFICRDEDLTMKAAAAYEYLKLGTQIIYLDLNRKL
ncbi:MAG TPA: hypothetical protein VF268_14175 [Gammaproteobacteria bacterium]